MLSQLLIYDQRVELQELAGSQTPLSDPTFATCKAHAFNSVKLEFSDKIMYVRIVWPETILAYTHAA